MATKTFNARFQFKGDTLDNWNAANPVLLKNELAIVTVPAEAGAVDQEPAVLFKVGDGTTAFKDLKFSSAVAADVYAWAKAAAKPGYSADEITGLADFIAGQVQDTDTQYKLEQDATDKHVLKLSSKAKDASDWTVVATITTADTVYDDTEVTGKVTALEGLVGSEAVATQIANAITALKLAETYATKADVTALTGRVSTLEGDDTGKSVRAIANEELAAQLIPENANESLDTLAEIAAWIQDHPGDAAAMNEAITKLQAIVAGIGGDGEKATVVAYVTDAIAALKIGDYAKASELTALATRVTTAEGKLDTLTGADTVEGSVAKALKDAKAYTDEKDTAMGTRVDAKANDADLAAIAKSGSVNDLVQADGDIVVFNCGSATTVI